MGRKMSEIVGRQENAISLLSQVHTASKSLLLLPEQAIVLTSNFAFLVSGGGIPVITSHGQVQMQPPHPGQAVPPPVAGQPVMARHEVDTLLAGQRELVNTAREMKLVLVLHKLNLYKSNYKLVFYSIWRDYTNNLMKTGKNCTQLW